MAKMNKSAEKWTVSVQSFANELSFYQYADTAKLCSFGAHVPRVLDVATAVQHPDTVIGDDRWFDRQFTTLLECLPPSDYEEFRAYDVGQTLAMLSYLARFHAYWWRLPGPEGRADVAVDEQGSGPSGASPAEWGKVSANLFNPGAWWRKPLRPSVKFEGFPVIFAELCANLPSFETNGLDNDDNRAMAQWIAGHVDDITAAVVVDPSAGDGSAATPQTGGEATPGPVAPGPVAYRTLVHGDVKTSNIFFKRRAEPSTAGPNGIAPPPPQLAAIDFQWTGLAASGMADVAYALAGAVQVAVLTGRAEDITGHAWYKGAAEVHSSETQGPDLPLGVNPCVRALLLHYHTELTRAFAERMEADSNSSTDSAATAAEGKAAALAATQSVYPLRAMFLDWQVELVDYAKTCLPYLLPGLTLDLCKENESKYGWLTHEYDQHATAWLVGSALDCARALKQRMGAGLSLGWDGRA